PGAPDLLHHEDLPGAEPLVDPGYVHVPLAGEVLPYPHGALRLAAEVELLHYRALKLVDYELRVPVLHLRDVLVEHGGHVVHYPRVLLYRLFYPGPLDLDHHGRAVLQHRPVHLGYRRRGDRRVVEAREHLPDLPA